MNFDYNKARVELSQLKTVSLAVTTNGGADTMQARKFLEAAERSGDKMTFYNVFTFLQERNIRLRGGLGFSPNEQCETFVNKFKEMFLLSESTSK